MYAELRGFLKLFRCACQYVCLCMCVYLPLKQLITSGVIRTQYDWLNKLYTFYMATLVVISSGVALELKRIMVTNPTSVSQHCINRYITVTVR